MKLFRMSWLWIAVALSSLGAGAHAQSTRAGASLPVEGVAGVVGSHASGQEVDVILRSDVYLYAALFVAHRAARLPLSADGTAGSGRTSETQWEEELGAAYDRILGEVLIAREARRVRVAGPAEELIDQELSRVEREAGGSARVGQLLDTLGASQDEVRAVAERRAWVANFLSVNLEGATTVTEAEVDAAIEALPEEARSDADRSVVRASLAKQALERAVRRWVGVLRVRTVHRELMEFPR